MADIGVGGSNVQGTGSTGSNPEHYLKLPWGINPINSWIDYRCWVETILDPGMVLHKPLPQSNPTPVDTLALINCQDPNLDQNQPSLGGVNISSLNKQVDIVQRMASSTYKFILRGWGLRAGYQVPIPGIVQIGGIQPTPIFPQRASQMLVGNISGVPVFRAMWELHYCLILSPQASVKPQVPVPFDPALHIRPDQTLPKELPVPVTIPDQAHTEGTLSKSVATTGGGTFPTPGPAIALGG